MKHFIHDLKNKADNFFQLELATKDRSIGFRIIVVTLVSINVLYIAYNLIRNIA
jgi:hypothetical protein